MRTVVPALLLALLLPLSACTVITRPPVSDQGPQLVRTATALGVNVALRQSGATQAQALEIQKHLLDAKLMLTTGTPPASALDALAAFLNTRITNSYVRTAVQAGILLIRTNVVIPVDGLVPEQVKVWILAVLDGAIDGCGSYATGYSAAGTVPTTVPDRIDFRG